MTDKDSEDENKKIENVQLMEAKKVTRFKVNKVDLSLSNPEELNKLVENEDSSPNYAKSFRHFTREALPRLDNYRNIMSIHAVYRPTLDELHEDNSVPVPNKSTAVAIEGSQDEKESHREQLGWFRGVYVKNLLNLWGIIFFLRLSWTLGQAGIMEGVLIIATSSVLAFITALSVSAISSNGLAQGGGTYVMISRSLGPEFGASIGLIFSLAHSVLTSVFIIGISEVAVTSFSVHLVEGDTQNVRILGVIILCLLLVCVVCGVTTGDKIRIFIFILLVLSCINILIGVIIGPQNQTQVSQGFVGFKLDVISQNLFSSYSPDFDFFKILGIYFPAVIGYLSGANYSKDLKDPCKDIPKGTLYSIVTATVTYIIVGVCTASVMVKDSTGIIGNTTSESVNITDSIYGLRNYFEALEIISAFSPLFYLAVLCAGLSAAFNNLMDAPRVFRTLCKDHLYPYTLWFSEGSSLRPHLLTSLLAVALILVGNLNTLAPLISTPFLAAYALINFSVFHASLVKPIGWRPTFKLYNMWLSLLGSTLCIVVMFLICWITALITLLLILALYLIIVYNKPDVNWGSTTQAQTYRSALEAVQSLNGVEEHVKNYQPQILVLCGLPSSRPALVDFANLITKNISLLMCGHITKIKVPEVLRKSLYEKAKHYFKVHKIKAFFTHVDEDEFDVGAKALLQCSGMGKLRPNILLMGYKSDWTISSKQQLQMYFNVIHMVLDNYKAMCILRVSGGLDYSSILADADLTLNKPLPAESLSRNVSASQFSHVSSSSDSDTSVNPNSTDRRKNSHVICCAPIVDENQGNCIDKSKVHPIPPTRTPLCIKKAKQELYRCKDGSELPKDILQNVTLFQKNQKKGTIDVWWLYDDGGLTLLLPYIISTRRNWSSCKLRVFTLANKKEELECEQRSMASLLAKFRIDYSDLIIITDITRKPHAETVEFYDNLVKPFLVKDDEDKMELSKDMIKISESDLFVLRDKTNRQLRLRELLLENSLDSDLIVMTLPMPRKNTVTSAAIYMTWLETITCDMPTFLFVRGNQTSVLTFYS